MTFSVQNAYFTYSSNTQKLNEKDYLLQNINFSINQSEIISILGANGAGKTTLVKCMLGLLKWTRGQSTLNGKNINSYKPKNFWSKTAYVPQAKNNAFAYTVEDLVLLGRTPLLGPTEKPHQKDYEMALFCLDQMGIVHLKDKLVSEISGGEHQLALIARALTCQPQLLVLDEPESNLDFRNQMLVMEQITKLRETQGISVIMNTHFPEHAINNSDKTIILFPDRSMLFGPTKETVTEENMSAAFSMNIHMETVSYNSTEHTFFMKK